MTGPVIPPRSTRPVAGFARRNWGKLTLFIVVFAPIIAFAIWATVALSYSYSSGERVGYNQKLSRKGWVCKTWEGEIALSNVPGQAPELFRYSVRDDSVARQIQQLAGRRVQLDYEQHVGVPTSCFGETEYFATGVRAVADPYAPGMMPVPAPASVPGTPTTPETAPAAPSAPAPGSTAPAAPVAPAPAVPAAPAAPVSPPVLAPAAGSGS